MPTRRRDGVDQTLHQLDSVDDLDMLAFEKAELANLEMPAGNGMRHHIPHFTHLFAGSSYAALYSQINSSYPRLINWAASSQRQLSF
ncbi:hypothetical protein SDRG_03804 [Saprolegnia diclina VS20]|uniref:Uncharacterized protein n=1 Tax=Saprolegnia diclina (strain VS20) TaxID=1156394 RepID=T0QVZ2_SAPDV|nr:hypothetical protein SDRG_03804 [Saprolegnia diclina VS20]EQC38846.1 hypothetical protein SDRG_03804 [Saprolegnia diclina VS20]|eukprot:XP_008607670.1 hypothetical protein SDRG_03804 [Saprolegnia diclina VS20]